MNTVAIVGKPNVGKSSLFNRIIDKKKAIIEDVPGVTRDRIYDSAVWLTKSFDIIDTGGIVNDNSPLQQNINNQVNFALEEADIIVFLVSYKYGVNNDDIYIAKLLKKLNKTKKIILCANMAETYQKGNDLAQFYNLGFGAPIMVSANHGIGIGDLLDAIIKDFKDESNNEKEDEFTFCIIGRPNVGKSSLTNAILNKERVIVSDVAGTTRDSIDVSFKYHQTNYTIIDTAGIRRKGKLWDNVEKYSVMRAQKAIERSQLILLVLDGSEEFKEQDEVIGGLASSANIPTMIIVNKIDQIKGMSDQKLNNIKKEIRNKFKHLTWAPIIFTSALEHKKLHHIFEMIEEIKEQATKKISTSLLNDVVLKAQMIQQAPLFKGNRINISYVTQIKSQIPSFVIFCNEPKYLHFSYARYIENQIRTAFGLDKVPITLYWKSKNARTRGINIDEKQ